MPDRAAASDAPSSRDTLLVLARAAGGALIVGTPLLLTMEMWWAGFTIPAGRLLTFLAVGYGTLLVLQHYSGMDELKTLGAKARWALVALGMGVLVAAVVLTVIGELEPGMWTRDAVGKLLAQSVPAGIGASVAMSQFDEAPESAEQHREGVDYFGSQGLSLGGAMLLGFGAGATEEPMIIGLALRWPQTLALVVVSIVVVHVVTYLAFWRDRLPAGRARRAWWIAFLADGISTYAVALLVSAMMLWTFGRIGPDVGLTAAVAMVAALAFATSLGAAAAELLL